MLCHCNAFFVNFRENAVVTLLLHGVPLLRGISVVAGVPAVGGVRDDPATAVDLAVTNS
jgi:hypothetical protein